MAVRFCATPSMRRAPIASTRACSTASKTARACCPAGCRRRCSAALWQASRKAMASAWPRTTAASALPSLRGGSGKRTLPPNSPGRSAAKATSSSGLRASARKQPVTARLKGSVGDSFEDGLILMLEAMRRLSLPRPGEAKSGQSDVHRGLRQFDPEATLIELCNDRPFEFVALVQEGESKRKTDIVEDFGIFRPGDHGAWTHYSRDVAVHERIAREIGDTHHFVDDVATLLIAIMLGLGQHDFDFIVVRQIIQRGDDRPAVHLALIDLLSTMIETRRVTEADGISRRKQPERRVRLDHLALVQQRQPPGCFQHALNNKHHIRPSGIIFVETERDIVLQSPGQNAFAEFSDLLTFLDDDGVFADQVDTADVTVEIDAHAGPVQACRDLLDVRGLAGAM